MNLKIVSDSSSNVFQVEGIDYTTVPLKIRAGEKEYVDDASLDVAGMVEDLKHHKGKSGSSCPNVQEWLDAFGGADYVFGLTITKHLSGSYNAGKQAADTYMEEKPGKKAFIIDSLSTGPEMMMIVDKIKELAAAGDDYETIKEKVLDYTNHNHTLFCLQSLTNLARNGRVSPAVAKIAGVLGIRVVGDVKGGEITPCHKPRGDRKAIQTLVEMAKERGFFDGGIFRIAHCYGEGPANALKDAILAEFPNAKITIEPTTALCSFYAEAGGLIIGFQGSYNENNTNLKY
ncbi:MAG: DegV family protein [Oscillospiraceae bacterium]|nr:DegV family protein [Oscillospiraceae bacterium]